ncbi:hypothetical protein [Nitrospirillum sp. BR 11163]|uniref:hypothetical protein n=1 Tax=Nitrospirillum sp. BR 11163 TaxID=3104323 RepID=UPI002AFFEB07|nr:hypothetical protein [Nitrospirillum sp. BR 11163]MEA1676825.1 hypothetical protein [Nitrospirillum sp. BR 11163]
MSITRPFLKVVLSVVAILALTTSHRNARAETWSKDGLTVTLPSGYSRGTSRMMDSFKGDDGTLITLNVIDDAAEKGEPPEVAVKNLHDGAYLMTIPMLIHGKNIVSPIAEETLPDKSFVISVGTEQQLGGRQLFDLFFLIISPDGRGDWSWSTDLVPLQSKWKNSGRWLLVSSGLTNNFSHSAASPIPLAASNCKAARRA